MRLIFKALLVLACLIPTLPAAGADSESRFIRIQRNENRDPVALQTAIAKYVPAARPLTGNTPPTVDQRLLSTRSHPGTPGVPQPSTDPPTRCFQPR